MKTLWLSVLVLTVAGCVTQEQYAKWEACKKKHAADGWGGVESFCQGLDPHYRPYTGYYESEPRRDRRADERMYRLEEFNSCLRRGVSGNNC